MTLILLFVLIVIATGFRLIQWTWFSRTLYLATFLLFIFIGCGLAPTWLLTYVQSPYATPSPIHWGKQNAIVLLGAGTEKLPLTESIEVGAFAYGRVAKTAAMYGVCKQTGAHCTVIVSGGDPQRHGISEAAVYGAYLQTLGVAQTDLLLESSSMNTWQNAQLTGPLLKERNIDTVLLVTSGLHMGRSLRYFAQAGVMAIPVRADYLSAKTAMLPTSYNFFVTDVALHEYIGIVRNQIYNRLGWNSPATQPGAL
ncbi:YdcF family protein [Glaciimonas sp. GG7]